MTEFASTRLNRPAEEPMADKTYNTLMEFWPFYLSEHADLRNRVLHFVGSTLVLVLVALSIVQANPWYLVGAPFAGYGFAWVGHFFVERNRPATFTYPVWSFICDWIMYFYIWTGQIGKQMEKHGIVEKTAQSAA